MSGHPDSLAAWTAGVRTGAERHKAKMEWLKTPAGREALRKAWAEIDAATRPPAVSAVTQHEQQAHE